MIGARTAGAERSPVEASGAALSRSLNAASEAILKRASTPVDGSSLAVFRIGFGLIAVAAVIRFFAYGWIDELYIQPTHHFTYYGFGWVQPWPAPAMYAHFVLLGVLGMAIAVGYRYRMAMTLFFLAFTYVELIDKTTYLNHYYWVSLASFIAIFLPLNREWSLDRLQGRVSESPTVPALAVWAVRAQLGIVYLFAGFAKLNPDWLLEAQPLRIWLSSQTHFPVLGPLMDEVWMAYLFSWSGAIFDLTIVGWLLWRRSRPFAYLFVIWFHIATWLLFPIGIFPWLMMAGTLVFFAPGWPRRMIDGAARKVFSLDESSSVMGSNTAPVDSAPRRIHVIALVAIAAFLGLQAVVAMRHFAYPGNVRWTEEGYRFSWRVLLTEKTGHVDYRVVDPATGNTWVVRPGEYLAPFQVERSSFRPDMLLQTGHWIAGDFAERGIYGVQVYADAFVSMNGEQARRLIDPDVDLAAQSDSLAPKSWILR